MTPDETPLLEPAPDAPLVLPDPSDRSDESDASDPSARPEAAAPTAPPPAEPPLWLGLDRRVVLGAAAVVVLLVLFFGVLLGKARHDLEGLRGELVTLRGELQRSQTIQNRGAILRMRADMQTLRQTLPPALAADAEAADAALRRIDERLRTAP